MQVCKYRYGKIGDPREPVSKIYSIGCGKFLKKSNKKSKWSKIKMFLRLFLGSHPDRVKNGGPDKSYHLFYSLCLLSRS